MPVITGFGRLKIFEESRVALAIAGRNVLLICELASLLKTAILLFIKIFNSSKRKTIGTETQGWQAGRLGEA
ncbi:MAG: hypothetical protein ABSE16_15840 [Verrucomicrobiota bacterium]|jgi:hypothetical protein